MLTASCLLSLLALYLMALARRSFWNPLVDSEKISFSPSSWPDVAVIVPARNEADMLPQTLPSLLNQDYPGHYKVFLVDDHSTDGTAETARALAEEKEQTERLTVLSAPDLPEGWAGKIAAMQTGVAASEAPFLLFTDADIEHPTFSLRRLVARAERDSLDLNSLMVKLHCVSPVEKVLIPAFVFFFSLLYPFRLTNDPDSKTAAAAGGVMLARRAALEKSGGLEAVKGALIDDCSLAKSIKKTGGKIFLALTENVKSVRPYKSFKDIHDMIARTAFTQLNLSNKWLAAALVAMAIVYLSPVLAFLSFEGKMMFLGGLAWFVMAALYAPMVDFYRLPPAFAATLPLAALFYMVATLNSARATWKGQGGLWKGRTQKP